MNTNVQQAYNEWSIQYDTNINKTRDLEAHVIREQLSGIDKVSILEIGCGTGKNSEWLVNRASKLVGVDLSPKMLSKARGKVTADHAAFIEADINTNWSFAEDNSFDLITFSLVLEHIQNLDYIFQQTTSKLKNGGIIYIGELHPFKQYAGSKARFETEKGLQIVNCYTHHISDFVSAATKHGLVLKHINEYFDDGDKKQLPRILALIFRRD